MGLEDGEAGNFGGLRVFGVWGFWFFGFRGLGFLGFRGLGFRV